MRPTVLLSLSILCGACVGDSGTSGGPSPDQSPDHAPMYWDWGAREIPVSYICDAVDILFVIDDSNTMEEEQQNLVANFPAFIQQIEAIDPPITDYHLGVISTDIGAGPYNVGTIGACEPGGDAGKLQHQPQGEGCAASYPPFLQGPGETMAQDFSCIARLGVTGCGFEQQMEAALQALTAQPYNDGFLRKNAPLAIVFITDEDDCSAADQSLFNLDDTSLGESYTRCVRLTDMLYPVSRYIDGFSGLKDNSDRLVVAAITGPAQEVQLNPYAPQGMDPACESETLGKAFPGNRFAELVRAFGDRGVQSSICDGDLASALEVVSKAIERVCLQ